MHCNYQFHLQLESIGRQCNGGISLNKHQEPKWAQLLVWTTKLCYIVHRLFLAITRMSFAVTLHCSSSPVKRVTVSDKFRLDSFTCSISARMGSNAAWVSPGNCWEVFWELDKGLLWTSQFEPDRILELSSSDGYLKLKGHA